MRRSLGLPITMAVIMIVLVILLIVGWTIATIWAATLEPKAPTFFWALLPIGALSLTVILAGVIVYLVLSVKLINLNQRQSNFIDAVTHELKSPLASLKLQVQTLDRLNIPEEKRKLIYQAMKNDVDR
ncbi:MAG: sensor histidine kinase, partial [Thermoguttaceae bacterium]|nr:sensor histidine kinase [Thermoguttaceae bacterium]